MKKIIAMLLAVVMVFALAACGGNSGSSAAPAPAAEKPAAEPLPPRLPLLKPLPRRALSTG